MSYFQVYTADFVDIFTDNPMLVISFVVANVILVLSFVVGFGVTPQSGAQLMKEDNETEEKAELSIHPKTPEKTSAHRRLSVAIEQSEEEEEELSPAAQDRGRRRSLRK